MTERGEEAECSLVEWNKITGRHKIHLFRLSNIHVNQTPSLFFLSPFCLSLSSSSFAFYGMEEYYPLRPLGQQLPPTLTPSQVEVLNNLACTTQSGAVWAIAQRVWGILRYGLSP